jgi:hypothetical protein
MDEEGLLMMSKHWQIEQMICDVDWEQIDAHEAELEQAADPFAHLYADPPPDTEWTQDDIDRLGDCPDISPW